MLLQPFCNFFRRSKINVFTTSLMSSDRPPEVAALLIALCKRDIPATIPRPEPTFTGNLKKSCNHFFEIYFIKTLLTLRNMTDCRKTVETSVDPPLLTPFAWRKQTFVAKQRYKMGNGTRKYVCHVRIYNNTIRVFCILAENTHILSKNPGKQIYYEYLTSKKLMSCTEGDTKLKE